MASCLTNKIGPKVGKYTVMVEDFEKAVLEILNKNIMKTAVPLFVIDEIGKMECYSKKFCDKIREIFYSHEGNLTHKSCKY